MVQRKAAIAARVGPNALVVDLDQGRRLSIDAQGRWSALGTPAGRYRRTLDGAVLRVVSGGFERVPDPESVHRSASLLAAEVLGELTQQDPTHLELIGDRAALIEGLQSAAAWLPADFEAERQRFGAAYPEPVPILPPHRYRDVVVLPATGCPNHSCTFCDFYKDKPFRALSDVAFETHITAVAALFGEALHQRGGIFLGSGSALSVSDRILLRRLRQLQRVWGNMPRQVATFHNPDLGKPRTPDQWQALVDAGLVDATVGLETGLPALRASVHKSPDVPRFIAGVQAMKAGGMGVAVTLLVGLAAPGQTAAHQRASVAAIAQMPLTATDRVYLSPLQGAVSREQAHAGLTEFRKQLRQVTDARVGKYLVERFAYFA
ncbi:MAG: radical SAM protein [Myxococcales bacterium]|nr:radical SAM protein [Myxococcales bacterium]